LCIGAAEFGFFKQIFAVFLLPSSETISVLSRDDAPFGVRLLSPCRLHPAYSKLMRFMRARKAPMLRPPMLIAAILFAFSAAAETQSTSVIPVDSTLGDFPQANKYYWIAPRASVRLCPKPAPDILDRIQCPEVTSGRFTVTEVVLFNKVPAYYRIEMDGGRAGYVRADDKARFLGEDPEVLAKAPRANCAKLGEPKIGMTTAEAEQTCWAKPTTINRMPNQTREQHVYGKGRYLYFENGILVAIEAGR
jgi:hypothetical protein